MAIYIKGMEMPTACENCLMSYWTGTRTWRCVPQDRKYSEHKGDNGSIRQEGCPLISEVSKTSPNYETDTEVRLAVTNRKKEKVILSDAFGSMGYVPSAETHEIRTETHGVCSDLISRADAICEVLVNDGIDNIVDRINALPSAEAEWIPVSERLPSEDGSYLIQKNWMHYGVPDMDVYYWAEGWNCYRGSDGTVNREYEMEDIIAWMPLPKPWKGADNDRI